MASINQSRPGPTAAALSPSAGGVFNWLQVTFVVVREVTRSRDLRRLMLAFLVFNAVESATWIAVLLYAYEATGAQSVGIVALAQLLPAALLAPLAATLGDDHPRERMLVGGYLLLAVTLGLTALAMLQDWSPYAVYLAAIAASISTSLIRPVQNALLPGLARNTHELTAANAVSGIAEAAGTLLGPLAVSFIVVAATTGAVLVVTAIAITCAGLLVLYLSVSRQAPLVDAGPAKPVPARAPVHYWHRILDGFRVLARHPDASLLVTVLASRMLMIGIVDVLFVLLALELFETGERGAALLTAALGAGGIIGGAGAFLLIGVRRIALVLAAAAILWGVTLASLVQPAVSGLAPLLMIVGGTGLTVMDIASRTFLQRAVRNDLLARVFGIVEGLCMAVLAAGSLLVTIVVALFGLSAAVIIFAAVLPLVILLTWPALRSLDARTAMPARELTLLRQVPMFEALSPPVLESLAHNARWERAPAGSVVIREGDPGQSYFIIESGALLASKDGRLLRRMSTPGDAFGEIALLRSIPRTASVTAETDSILLVLDRADFIMAVTGNPVAAEGVDRLAQARLEDRD